jgi:two-component system OmpR family response regulator
LDERILIVDDEPGIREVLQGALEDEGYATEAVGTAMEALSTLDHEGVNLAIVDLLLPDIDGLQVAEAIRFLDPGTPVILMTAYGTPSFESMASHPAITHYVHKPFSLDHVLALVQTSLSHPPRIE